MPSITMASRYYSTLFAYIRACWGARWYGRKSTEPVIPNPRAYPSNNSSNLFLLFGGTYNVTSIPPSLLTHAPSMNLGFGGATLT